MAEQLSVVGIVVFHALDAFVAPPSQYPDLFTMGNVLVSCGTFFVCLVYFTVHQLRS